jgi:hypothetical protein
MECGTPRWKAFTQEAQKSTVKAVSSKRLRGRRDPLARTKGATRRSIQSCEARFIFAKRAKSNAARF